MKQLKVTLSALALVFAIGGTFATQIDSSFDPIEFEFIENGGPMGQDVCVQLTEERCGNGINGCTISGHPVGSLNSASTQCGTQLKERQ